MRFGGDVQFEGAVGETILDEYQYCEAMGKSGKEPVLATRYLSTDKFAGGVLVDAESRSQLGELLRELVQQAELRLVNAA